MSSTSVSHQVFRGGGGADTVSFPLPLESGFVAKGYDGQDRLRLLAHPNPALKPTVRIDQRKSRTTIRGLTPTTLTGTINGFSDVFLPGQALSIYKGTNGTDVVTAHPDFRAKIFGRDGADVLTGSRQPDRLDGGPGFDIVRGRNGNDTCLRAERRSSC
jgi:Ca2+-binding RTX toxin-like protein